MPTTRPQMEFLMILWGGDFLAKAGLDVLTVDGTNAHLGPVIARALLEQDLPLADIAGPTDEELAGLSGLGLKRFLAFSELYVLELALSRWAFPDAIADTDNREDNGKLGSLLRSIVNDKRAKLEKEYGLGEELGSLSTGTLDLGFMATLDDDGGCR